MSKKQQKKRQKNRNPYKKKKRHWFNVDDPLLGTKTRSRSEKKYTGQTEEQKKYAKYLESDDWKFTKLAFEEDHFRKCFACNGFDRIDLHHISYKNLGVEREEDLCWLCRCCHKKVHEMVDNKICSLKRAHVLLKRQMLKMLDEFDCLLEEVGKPKKKTKKKSEVLKFSTKKKQKENEKKQKEKQKEKHTERRQQLIERLARQKQQRQKKKVDGPLSGTKTAGRYRRKFTGYRLQNKQSPVQKQYDQYLKSEAWGWRKWEFAEIYPIYCFVCGVDVDIVLHHTNYANVGNEKDEDLCWLCKAHHSEVHRMVKTNDSELHGAHVKLKKMYKYRNM